MRSEFVLKRDGTDVQTNDQCAATSGRWASPYDGAVWAQASDVDIDHMVPLKNAWIVRSTPSPYSAPIAIHYMPMLTSTRLLPRPVRRCVLAAGEAQGLCQRHRPPAALGRHRQRQPGQG